MLPYECVQQGAFCQSRPWSQCGYHFRQLICWRTSQGCQNVEHNSSLLSSAGDLVRCSTGWLWAYVPFWGGSIVRSFAPCRLLLEKTLPGPRPLSAVESLLAMCINRVFKSASNSQAVQEAQLADAACGASGTEHLLRGESNTEHTNVGASAQREEDVTAGNASHKQTGATFCSRELALQLPTPYQRRRWHACRCTVVAAYVYIHACI